MANDLITFIHGIVSVIQVIGAAICFIGVVAGGIMRATAFGNERRMSNSNIALACAVVGLVIVLLAGPAVDTITSYLPATNQNTTVSTGTH